MNELDLGDAEKESLPYRSAYIKSGPVKDNTGEGGEGRGGMNEWIKERKKGMEGWKKRGKVKLRLESRKEWKKGGRDGVMEEEGKRGTK